MAETKRAPDIRSEVLEIQFDTGERLATVLERAERLYLEALMNEVQGSRAAAARRAGISYSRLMRRLDCHQIVPRFVALGR